MYTLNNRFFAGGLSLIIALSLLFSACTPYQATPTKVPPSSIPGTDTTSIPTKTQTANATSAPLPQITLRKGDSYFSFDGRQSFLFSRNITGQDVENLSDFERFLDYAQAAGDHFVRLQIDNLGPFFKNNGEAAEFMLGKWDKVFDMASERGLHVIPAFGVWIWWNQDVLWKDNPLNAVKGGPADSPSELFKRDSETQKLWLKFVQKLVEHWQSRENILAWEIFSEINLAHGSSNANALDFIEPAAAVIRAADSQQRPITVSLCDECGVWTNANRSEVIDFIQVHPYPVNGQLDREIIAMTNQRIRDFKRPVLIGESGLTGIDPDPFKHQPNAPLGIRHAIWADIVSGAMNGRALWDQDSYTIYDGYWKDHPYSDILEFAEVYSKLEIPMVKFVQGVDFAGFQPLPVNFPAGTKVWGAAVGNEKMVIGWFRDADCEPPNWPLQPVISGQTVSITVPGSASEWKVDFYDTKTGTDITNSMTTIRQGDSLIILLPDFTDDIAFKMYSQD
jgi:hypothetical protein